MGWVMTLKQLYHWAHPARNSSTNGKKGEKKRELRYLYNIMEQVLSYFRRCLSYFVWNWAHQPPKEAQPFSAGASPLSPTSHGHWNAMSLNQKRFKAQKSPKIPTPGDRCLRKKTDKMPTFFAQSLGRSRISKVQFFLAHLATAIM